jgi:hypothetical protein
MYSFPLWMTLKESPSFERDWDNLTPSRVSHALTVGVANSRISATADIVLIFNEPMSISRRYLGM